MEIDEAIVIAGNMTYKDAIMNTFQSKGIKYKKATRIKLNEMLQKLEWYENQDLIRRGDAISKLADIAKHYEDKEEIFIGGVVRGCAIEIQRIPKAEPKE